MTIQVKQIRNGGFYWERQMYQSPAFLDLPDSAKTMLIALLDARQREPRSQAKDKKGNRRIPTFINLKRIEMPYTTLQKVYGMNQQGIVRAIDKLLANGFVEITHKGGLGEHDKAKYALINDYLAWKPGVVFRKRDRDVRRGYQGKKIGASGKLAHEIIPSYTHQNHTLSEDFRSQNHTPQKHGFSFVSVQNLNKNDPKEIAASQCAEGYGFDA